MLVRRVVDLDFMEIRDWYASRQMIMPAIALFPPTGFIVSPYAAGFLYFTDSDIAIIDGYIGNPNADKKDRDIALDLITDKLIEKARARGCKQIKCDSALTVCIHRAKKFKFKSTGRYESFIMEL